MRICRTCLQVLNSDANCLSLDTDDCTFDSPSVRSKLLVCVPELALDVVQSAVICTSCSDALDTAYDFKNKCLRTEEKILHYTQFTGCTADSVNMSEVVQFSEPEGTPTEPKQLTEIHYPITQIIEQDSEIDIKPIILNSEMPNHSPAPEPYLYESEINVKTESEAPVANGAKQKPLAFNPELDVEVRGYNFGPMDVFQHSTLGDSMFGCMYCQKSFLSATDLETHLAAHMENRPLKCTMCDRRFVRKDKLMLHMRIHTGEKPFECPMCGRCFSRKDKLNNHMRTHTGEKPHQCILCQKCFARKDKMNTHMRSQHWLALANLEITVVKNAEPSVAESAASSQ